MLEPMISRIVDGILGLCTRRSGRLVWWLAVALGIAIGSGLFLAVVAARCVLTIWGF